MPYKSLVRIDRCFNHSGCEYNALLHRKSTHKRKRWAPRLLPQFFSDPFPLPPPHPAAAAAAVVFHAALPCDGAAAIRILSARLRPGLARSPRATGRSTIFSACRRAGALEISRRRTRSWRWSTTRTSPRRIWWRSTPNGLSRSTRPTRLSTTRAAERSTTTIWEADCPTTSPVSGSIRYGRRALLYFSSRNINIQVLVNETEWRRSNGIW